MTQSQLIQHFSVPDRKITVAKLGLQLRREKFSLRELVDLTFYLDQEIALKASRLLEYILFKFPENYYQDIEYFIGRAKDADTAVSKKSYAKILMHITSPDVPKDVRDKIREIDLENIVGLCFEWMENPRMLVSTRASVMEALFNLRHQYPWIAEQLSKRLELLSQSASPYLLTKCNYILGYLHPED
jgi:hypothetical protein